MIEATCTTCGTIHRVQVPELSGGARFLTCTSCKSRVALPSSSSPSVEPLTIPRLAEPPTIPRSPGGAVPRAPTSRPTTPRSSTPGGAPSRSSGADLDFMPPDSLFGPTDTPSRGALPPRSAAQPSKTDITDLPAPKNRRTGTLPELTKQPAKPIVDLPAPKAKPRLQSPPAQAGPVSRPPPRPLLDLPAPKPRGIGELPPSSLGGLGDLPAPKRSTPAEPLAAGVDLLLEDLPAPRPSAPANLPAPRKRPPSLPGPRSAGAPDLAGTKPGDRAGGIPDLPAPKPGSAPDLPAPKQAATPDLPAPKQAAPLNLPTPKQAAPPNLPTPKQAAPPNLPAPRIADLPTPKPGATPNLPAPKHAAAPDLPTPKPRAGADLPAHRSAAHRSAAPTDLLTPKQAAAPDLPVPQGFFDDLPQPAIAPGLVPELPAPKGFFDDLPGRPIAQPAEPPAPKGFFDDLPGRPIAQPAEPPAPKGFFDDLPGRPVAQPAEPPAPKGFFDDLPGLPVVQPAGTAPPGASDFGAHASRTPPGPSAPPSFADLREEVSDVVADALGVSRLDTLELDPPAIAQPAINFPPRSPTPRAPTSRAMSVTTPPPDEPTTVNLRRPETENRIKPVRTTATVKTEKSASLDEVAARARRMRLLRFVAVIAVSLAALGTVGFFLYRRHAEGEARRASIEEHLTAARTAFGAKDPKRWERAAAAALAVLELDPRHAAAIGLGAEALLADANAYGLNATAKAANARQRLGAAIAEGTAGPEIVRAQALSVGTAKQPNPEPLRKLAVAAPNDLALALYLGWSYAARGDAAAAVKELARATGAEPLRLLALVARGRAKIALGELAGARTDFAEALAVDKDHLAAQVGLAAALSASQAPQQEADLLEILARKDLAAGDPRAVREAWLLAAEAARRERRLDQARERYAKAQALAPQDPAAMAGLAEVEILEGKLELAGELVEKALAADPSSVRAGLVAADLAIRQKRIEDADARLQALTARKATIAAADRSRLALLSAHLLEAQGRTSDAADAFHEAAELAGEIDVSPALTAVTKLGAFADAADAARDSVRAAVLRGRVAKIVARLEKAAERDPQLAIALGAAFLQANDPRKAEPWLRLVTVKRPRDADAAHQLARALALLGRTEDAIAELRRAAEIDARAEIGIELARIYELARREDEASEVYAKLLAKSPGLEARASAGRFYARHGELARAAAQGEKILAVDPAHPTGLYLKAEGALAAGKAEEAAKLFRAAADAERDPQFFDGQGRAAEELARQTGDSKLLEAALRAYLAASAAAPALLNPLLGQGRIYVARRDASKAIPPLLAASQLAPNHPEVSRFIGLAYKELGERRVAVEWLARAYKLAPSAETAWNIGQLHGELNAPREAVTALTNATKLGLQQEKQSGASVPWLTEALYRLGRIHMDSGNDRGAKSAWEKYVARGPKASAQLDEVRRELATTLQRY